jgi:hypothetical protein
LTYRAHCQIIFNGTFNGELLALCEQLGITAYKSWTKAQIIDTMNARKAERAELLARASNA